MTPSKIILFCLFSFTVYALIFIAPEMSLADSSRIPLPTGRDIRKITGAENIKPADINNLAPGKDGIKYYYQRFSSTRLEGETSIEDIEIYFITLLPLDYSSVDRFATELFGADRGLKSVEGVVAAMPNLMSYLRDLSTGEIGQFAEPVGHYIRITLKFKLDEKKLAEKYPDVRVMIARQYIRSFSFDLRNGDKDLLLSFKYRNDTALISFVLDPKGYFVAAGPDGRPLDRPGKRLGLEEARRGVRLYLDAAFESRAELLGIFKLFRVDVERIRFLIDFGQTNKGLDISWRAVEVIPGRISVSGVDPEPVGKNILNLKDTLTGTIEFRPLITPDGNCFTFMRVFGRGEKINHWLVDLALLTWEQIAEQAIADLTLPIVEALMAVQTDVMIERENRGR